MLEPTRSWVRWSSGLHLLTILLVISVAACSSGKGPSRAGSFALSPAGAQTGSGATGGGPATPSLTAPSGLAAMAGNASVTLSWNAVAGATAYNLYFAQTPGVTPQNGTALPAVPSPYAHSGLLNGVTYSYVVTATDGTTESAASSEVSATPYAGSAPPVPPLFPPLSLQAAPGNASVTLTWITVPGATGYHLYWDTKPGVTPQTGVRISYVNPPATHAGLQNGTTYYYVATAYDSYQESQASNQASATPAGTQASGSWVELAGSAQPAGLSNSVVSCYRPALALDPQGNPVVAWQTTDTQAGTSDVHLRRFNGQVWTEVAGSATGGGVSGTGEPSLACDVAVDRLGRITVAWTEHEASTSRLLRVYLKRWSGALWEPLGGSTSPGGLSMTADHAEAVSIAHDAADNPVVCWEQTVPNTWPRERAIYLKKWSGTAWTALGGSDTGSGLSQSASKASQMPSVVMDSNGRPVVAYLDGPVGAREVHVRRFDGSTWVAFGTSASPGGVSGSTRDDYAPALGLDLQGNPFVAWSNPDAQGVWQIYAKRWSGQAWVDLAGSSTDSGLSATTGASRFPCAAADALGNPLIGWSDTTPGNGWSTYLRQWTGSAWQEVAGSASGRGLSNVWASSQLPSLATDTAGRPAVAWEYGANPNQIQFRWLR